jgi:hypothetical protein
LKIGCTNTTALASDVPASGTTPAPWSAEVSMEVRGGVDSSNPQAAIQATASTDVYFMIA